MTFKKITIPILTSLLLFSGCVRNKNNQISFREDMEKTQDIFNKEINKNINFDDFISKYLKNTEHIKKGQVKMTSMFTNKNNEDDLTITTVNVGDQKYTTYKLQKSNKTKNINEQPEFIVEKEVPTYKYYVNGTLKDDLQNNEKQRLQTFEELSLRFFKTNLLSKENGIDKENIKFSIDTTNNLYKVTIANTKDTFKQVEHLFQYKEGDKVLGKLEYSFDGDFILRKFESTFIVEDENKKQEKLTMITELTNVNIDYEKNIQK